MIDPTELHAYADGELTKDQEAAVEALLATDAKAQVELQSIRALKNALATKSEPIECAAEWSRCRERLTELDKAQRTESFVTRYGWAMAGALFLFIVIGGVFNRFNTSGDMQSADLARAVASLSPAGSPRSQEPRHIRQFLDSLVGAAAQSIKSDRLVLVGGETGEVDGHRVSRLQLRDNAGDLSLLVIGGELNLSQFAPLEDSRFKSGQIQGVNSVAWSDGQNTLVLAGPRPYEDLVQTVLTKVLR